jgi:hypothetical protein
MVPDRCADSVCGVWSLPPAAVADAGGTVIRGWLHRRDRRPARPMPGAWLPDTTARPVATERVSADWVGG